MKKVFVVALVLLAMAMGAAQAQNSVFKINVLSPVVRTGSVFYEQAISQDKSLQLGLFYTGFRVDETKFRGYGITPEYRQYLSTGKTAPEGFYVAPFLRFQSLNLEVDESDWYDEETGEYQDIKAKASLNTVGGGLLIGRQWIFKERFVLDTFFGPSYNAGSVKVESGEEDMFNAEALAGFGIRTGVSFGIRF
ncbi:DUF3575 domain-containing protein [Pontibacter locisalis]|uniref:DUF3575 domain-containing protein n=1 Tax=Pontibacter locisalis TaxID=1719035 RepID=A0ABW5IJY5_9BACT